MLSPSVWRIIGSASALRVRRVTGGPCTPAGPRPARLLRPRRAPATVPTQQAIAGPNNRKMSRTAALSSFIDSAPPGEVYSPLLLNIARVTAPTDQQYSSRMSPKQSSQSSVTTLCRTSSLPHSKSTTKSNSLRPSSLVEAPRS